MKYLCPFCGKKEDLILCQKEYTLLVKEKEICVEGYYFKCPSTEYIFQSSTQLDALLKHAKEKYSELYELVTPTQIRNIRRQYDISQKAFGIIIGMGELTINKYEQGIVPVSSNRMLIELAKDPYCFKKMYELNKHKISAYQRRKIEKSDAFQKSLLSNLGDISYELSTEEKMQLISKSVQVNSTPLNYAVEVIKNDLDAKKDEKQFFFDFQGVA